MAFAPIITRLYGPEAFGLLGTFVAILAVITPLAALSYPIAIVLPKNDADAIGLAKMSLLIALATSLLTAFVLLVFGNAIVDIFNLEAVGSFILLLPVAMFLSTGMAVANQWVIRKKLFKLKAKVAVMQALWLNSAKAGVGLILPVAAVLVIFTVLGSALHSLMLYLGIRKHHSPPAASDPVEDAGVDAPGRSFKDMAWQHRDFAYYRTPQIFLNAASQNMPVLMLISFFGPAAAGFYSLGKLVLGLPSILIGQSVASVFYPRINEAVHAGENSRRLIMKASLALAAVGVAPYGIVVLFGPWLFAFVFGEEWRMAGVYAQWLALWSYFGFINRPSIAAIPVLSLQGFFLGYEVVSVACRAMALAAGFFYFKDELVAVALFSGVNVLLSLSLVLATLVAAGRHDRAEKVT